jgi:hypothetical protein
MHFFVNYSTANERAEFVYFNNTTGEQQSVYVRKLPSVFYDGSYGDFIDERRALIKTGKYLNLPNFGVAKWSRVKVFTSGGSWQKLGKVNRERTIMHEAGGQVLAGPGYLRPDGKSFQNNWFHCHP